jgi:DNA polymerase
MSIDDFTKKYGHVECMMIVSAEAFETFNSTETEEAKDMQSLLFILDKNKFDFSKPEYLAPFRGDILDFPKIEEILKRNKQQGFTITEEPKGVSERFAPLAVKRLISVSKQFCNFRIHVMELLGQYDAKHFDGEIKELSIDIETYSSNDITDGVYKYAEADDFDILLFSYSINRGAVLQVDLVSGEKLPEKILSALYDPKIVKTAFNAAFERTCLSKWLCMQNEADGMYEWNTGWRLDPAQWECSMVRASMMGLPMQLKACGEVLKLKDQKMHEGVALIKYFSCPCRATKANGGRTRNMPSDAPEKWEVYKKYNRRDVEVEVAIRNIVAVNCNPITDLERELYIADQHINDRGVKIERTLAENAVKIDEVYKGRLNAECQQITGLDNPNSPMQLKGWMGEKLGHKITSLTKEDYPKMMQTADGDVKRVLTIRTEMAKTSTAKYNAMVKALCEDGRVHGMLQFYGSHTGRWAGRIVQVQNLPQNHIEDLDFARNLLLDGDLALIEACYGNVPDTLSQLIRTAFVAKEGHTFIVCDYSAIEARVIAWLAGEDWRLKVFHGDGKIYEASASQMFNVPAESIGHDSPLRKKGKISELALGYQGGPMALVKMGGEKFMRLFVEDKNLEGEDLIEAAKPYLQDIVTNWRNASPSIVKLWVDLEKNVRETLVDGKMRRLRQGGLVVRRIGEEFIQIKLPSGRFLSYPQMHISEDDQGRAKLVYMGMNQTTHKWVEIPTYGGRLTENVVQAIARDCLGITILRLERAGYPVVFHIHDECICEVPDDGSKTLEEMQQIFAMPIPFAKDLPLKGAGYVTKYYLKD